ncbi:MAG TPA: flagellar biosynthetic protein FliR [Oligoflexia bacterium]|nr:flagellar biosynthetic protein FliR [Oligoflexia bacterium]HMP48780.1 flagellar biosynthetic protein FliR [Oligoflexia bacterium]
MSSALLSVNNFEIGIAPLWTFVLILVRISTLLFMLPGVGTEQIPAQFRLYLAMSISVLAAMSIPQIPMPEELHLIVLSIATEAIFGLLLSLLPAIVLGGLAVSGQVIAGVIGLGQANMIDRSLGESVSVLAKFNMYLGSLVFLAIDGHHVLLKAATLELGYPSVAVIPSFNKGIQILMTSFSSSFELAIAISAPILIATLVTQFLLGLITKFVPQVNIFIISLPLSVFMGFYIMSYTIEPFASQLVEEFTLMEELAGAVVLSKSSP